MSASLTPLLSAKHWRGKGVVLAVDDDQAVRHTAARLIAHFGFQVREADSGHAALTELHSILSSMHAVLFSVLSTDVARRRLRGQDITRFLQKPFSFEMLRESLRAVFD